MFAGDCAQTAGPGLVACESIEIRLIKRDAAWLSKVEPTTETSLKTPVRQSFAFESMIEKSSLAFWALLRVLLVGALALFVGAGFAD